MAEVMFVGCIVIPHPQSALLVIPSFWVDHLQLIESCLKSITSVFQSQGFLFSLLAVTFYGRLPQYMVLSSSHRQDIQI